MTTWAKNALTGSQMCPVVVTLVLHYWTMSEVYEYSLPKGSTCYSTSHVMVTQTCVRLSSFLHVIIFSIRLPFPLHAINTLDLTPYSTKPYNTLVTLNFEDHRSVENITPTNYFIIGCSSPKAQGMIQSLSCMRRPTRRCVLQVVT